MRRGAVLGLAVFVAAAAALVPAQAQARSGRVDGTLTVRRTTRLGASASWRIGSRLLGARSVAIALGLPVDPWLRDANYPDNLAARLTAAHQDAVVVSCGDGMGGTTRTSIDGVARSATVMYLRPPMLNLLSGHGTLQLGLSGYPGNQGFGFWAPGLSTMTQKTNCWRSPQTTRSPVPAASGTETAIFSYWLFDQIYNTTWRVRRSASNTWTLARSRTIDEQYVGRNRVSLALRLRGKPRALDATCVIPSDKQFRRAHSLRAARRLAARAGFPHVKVRSRYMRTVKKGRYVIWERSTAAAYDIQCGYRGLRLVRSRGWPFST